MTLPDGSPSLNRRHIVAGVAGMGLSVVLRPAAAQANELAAAVAAYTQGAPVRAGKVKLDVAELVDNGNVVPITVTAESPMTVADHVKTI
ncbi:MAG: sulfur oxidation protein SoxY, partial [Polaromonas sp.]|nr:sulfur oxidation protein SoxY [Polaromonas sp.]